MITERRNAAGRPGRAQDGFTFTELLVTVIILGLLAAVILPSFLGVRDDAAGAGAESIVRTAASAVESASVDSGYEAVTLSTLQTIEPSFQWLDAEGAVAANDEVSITDLSASGFTLTAKTDKGVVFTYTKDVESAPTVTRTCGPGCSW